MIFWSDLNRYKSYTNHEQIFGLIFKKSNSSNVNCNTDFNEFSCHWFGYEQSQQKGKKATTKREIS